MEHASEGIHGRSYITRADLDRIIPYHVIPDIIREGSRRGLDEKQKEKLIKNVQ